MKDETRKPISRLELLSPTNKPPGDGYIQYVEKREATLVQKMPLIEIDYLHESRPVPRGVPSYPDQDPQAHPYTIYLTDTRTGLKDGKTLIYGFDVDDFIPRLYIPLADDEQLAFDFGTPYKRTYESLSYFRNRVDYTHQPLRFETYTPFDQARIQTRMSALAVEA